MNQVPAFLANRVPRGLADAGMSGLGSPRPPHISRKGNRFTRVDGAGNEKPVTLMDPETGAVYIDLVVIDTNPNPSKMYFGGVYKEDSNDPPLCWSDNGIGPSSKASQPQSPTCAVCPHHVWGSAVSKVTGAATRACRDGKKIAVLVAGDDDGLVYEFLVPPGSFSDKETGWVRYCKSIAGYMIGNRKADLCDVITRVSFVAGQMGVLAFQPTGLINEAIAVQMDKAWAAGITQEVCGALDKPRDPNQPVGAVTAQARPAGQLPPPPVPQPMPQAVGQAVPATPFIPNQGETPVRRGRKPKEAQVEQTLDIPPFLQRNPPPAPPPAPAQAAFGLVETPQAPPNEVLSALDQAFNLPTK